MKVNQVEFLSLVAREREDSLLILILCELLFCCVLCACENGEMREMSLSELSETPFLY